MPRARLSYTLLTSQNQGGGNKKQGLPSTIGLGTFSMNLIQRKAGYCPCVNPKIVPTTTSAPTTSTTTVQSCEKANLKTVTKGKLTIATGDPAYYPWIIDDTPETENGFEGAVAYAVAKELGFDAKDVIWVRTTFDSGISSGKKNFDFNLQQVEIDKDRNEVDFSSPYYTLGQTIVSYEGSNIEGTTTLAQLKGATLGATGPLAIDAIVNQLNITPQVFDDSDDAIFALINKEIDGIVVDLPTAFYVASILVPNGIIVGQLPSTGEGNKFGLTLSKGSDLTPCVSAAVDKITANGTLALIEDKWLSIYAPLLI